jgi:hypothetical protein
MPDVDQKFNFSDLEVRVVASFSRAKQFDEPERYADGRHVLTERQIEITHVPTGKVGIGWTAMEALIELGYISQHGNDPLLRKIDLT